MNRKKRCNQLATLRARNSKTIPRATSNKLMKCENHKIQFSIVHSLENKIFNESKNMNDKETSAPNDIEQLLFFLHLLFLLCRFFFFCFHSLCYYFLPFFATNKCFVCTLPVQCVRCRSQAERSINWNASEFSRMNIMAKQHVHTHFYCTSGSIIIIIIIIIIETWHRSLVHLFVHRIIAHRHGN